VVGDAEMGDGAQSHAIEPIQTGLHVDSVRRQRNPDFGASDLREAFQLIRFMVMQPSLGSIADVARPPLSEPSQNGPRPAGCGAHYFGPRSPFAFGPGPSITGGPF